MELLLLQIALEHRDQSCLSAGSPLRRVNLIISISLSFVALMYSALRILCWRLLWRRILHGNDSAHLSSTLPPVRRSAHPHTHTHTQFFPSLAKCFEQQKKPAVYVVGITPLGIFFWKCVVCTCQLLLYKGVIYSRDHMQIPSAKHQRTDWGV